METTVYRIPTQTEYYGPECPEAEAMRIAKATQIHLMMYAHKQGWDDVEFEIVPEVTSYNNQSRGDPEIIEWLDDYVSKNWINW